MTRFRKHLPPLGSLVPFEAAFRLGSFTRAADELAISQTSVSRRIRELEHDLGVPLFVRRRYDVEPTEDGVALAASVRGALTELREAAIGLRSRAAGDTELTIFSCMSLGNALVAPCVGEFQRRNPKLQLHVLSSLDPIETIGDDFDIGFQYGRWAADRFEVEPIADEVVFPVCAPELVPRLPAHVSAKELATMPLLHLVDNGRDWPDWRSFLAAFNTENPEPIEGPEFSSYQICLDVAEQAEGIALGWGHAVKERLSNGRLTRITDLEMRLPGFVNVYRRRNSHTKKVADQFVSLMCEKASERG